MAEFSSAIGRDLEARLADSGLFAKEARAMVNTWRESYFQTDGVRVLFVLPQSWTNAYIPLRIHPAPRETVRVMVGRVEVLTPEREREAERAVLSLSSNDPSARERAFSHLLNQGRYVEPVLRRAIATSSDARVQSLVRRLLSTDFVKEIRATAARADDLEAPMTAAYQRAQLAALLRDVGLETEAKQEGERALAVLAKLPPPDLSAHASRHTLRALARANEGAGRYTDALRWYGDFVSFGSRSTLASCSGCHAIDGPQTMSYFRDWWAGRRYAQLAKRTGIDMRLVQDQLAALKSAPQDRAAQMRLAYLYEARGESAKAGRLWSEIDPGGDVGRTPAP